MAGFVLTPVYKNTYIVTIVQQSHSDDVLLHTTPMQNAQRNLESLILAVHTAYGGDTNTLKERIAKDVALYEESKDRSNKPITVWSKEQYMPRAIALTKGVENTVYEALVHSSRTLHQDIFHIQQLPSFSHINVIVHGHDAPRGYKQIKLDRTGQVTQGRRYLQ